MAAEVPAWKQAILEQKRAKEEALKEPKVEDKYANLPAWKRDLLIKKDEEAKRALEKDKDKPRAGFTTILPGKKPSSEALVPEPAAVPPLSKPAPALEGVSVRERMSSIASAKPADPVAKSSDPAPVGKLNLRSITTAVMSREGSSESLVRPAPVDVPAGDGAPLSLKDRLSKFGAAMQPAPKEPAKPAVVSRFGASAPSHASQPAAAPAPAVSPKVSPKPSPAIARAEPAAETAATNGHGNGVNDTAPRAIRNIAAAFLGMSAFLVLPYVLSSC